MQQWFLEKLERMTGIQYNALLVGMVAFLLSLAVFELLQRWYAGEPLILMTVTLAVMILWAWWMLRTFYGQLNGPWWRRPGSRSRLVSNDDQAVH